MKSSNNLLKIMFETEVMFDCSKCKRFWLFKDFAAHTTKKQCILDPNAPNYIDKIKVKVSAAE